MPKYAAALSIALAGDAATAAFLAWGLIDAPGGIAGVLASDSILRLLLLRVAAVLLVALTGTWLLWGDPRLGSLFLIGTAIASAFAIPSPYWAVPATLLATAGAIAATDSLLLFLRWKRAAEVAGLACLCVAGLALVPALLSWGLVSVEGLRWPVVAQMLLPAGVIAVIVGVAALNLIDLAGLGLLILAASLTLGAVLTVVGAPGGLMTAYARVPGAQLVVARIGDTSIVLPPPEPEWGLTPVPASTKLDLAPTTLHLAPGQTATVLLNVNSDTAIQSIGFDLGFDPRLVSVQEVAAGPALDQWGTDHQMPPVSLPGIQDASGLTIAGVGLVSGDLDNAGIRSGSYATFTIRAETPGQTDLNLRNIKVYSHVDGHLRHHTETDSHPPAVHIIVS